MAGIKINDSPGPSETKPGRLIVEYLQENSDGATAEEIYRFLREQTDRDSKSGDDLLKTIDNVLAKGTTLGFLERKGSRFMTWVAREMCGRRRRRRKSRCCRRRRPRRRRRCCRC